jgi:hypothetical protein
MGNPSLVFGRWFSRSFYGFQPFCCRGSETPRNANGHGLAGRQGGLKAVIMEDIGESIMTEE